MGRFAPQTRVKPTVGKKVPVRLGEGEVMASNVRRENGNEVPPFYVPGVMRVSPALTLPPFLIQFECKSSIGPTQLRCAPKA